MNILFVLETTETTDIRILKEAKALIKAGHKIFLLCLSDTPEDKIERVCGMTVIRVYIKNPLLHAAEFYLKFIKSVFIKHISEAVKKYGIDVIHIHDLPLVKTGLIAAKKFNIMVVADFHENYPAAMENRFSKNEFKSVLRRFTIDRYSRWKRYERSVIKKVDKIIIVVPEAGMRFKSKEIQEKLTVVSNTTELDFAKDSKVDKSLLKKYKDFYVISYIGVLGHHRGINVCIKAMPYLINKIKKIRLLLVGPGWGYLSKLKKLVKDLNVESSVEFTGEVPFEKVLTYNLVSRISLTPHNFSEHTDTTVPHKLFQAMAVKIPLIVSSCAPLKRIVEETKSGLVFKAGDEKDLAEKVIEMYNNKKASKKMGENGYKAVKGPYGWANDAKRLVKMYKELE
jgi:glycosyltransferase involved in cell wall biosynthesis